MEKKEKALELHAKGYNCAQSVLMTLEEYTGIAEEQAANIATGFGGGAGCRELCGALSGGFMAAGAMYGADNRGQVMSIDREIINAFRARFGAVRCEDLKAQKIPCDDLIAFVTEKADELLSK